MEISKNVYLDNLIKENIFSYLPKNRFKEGVFYSPMNFYDYEINDMLVENYEFTLCPKSLGYLNYTCLLLHHISADGRAK